MTLERVRGVSGDPWEREIRGRLERLVVESELLAGNPLGDPARRPLWVYLPPGIDDAGEYPSIYLIQGYTGQLDMWLNRTPFEPNMIERVDELFSAGDIPAAVVVFVDAWTSYGGSQFVNSTSTGPYMDYLCDEVVPFVDATYPTAASGEHRGITGKSSGGYGAMVIPMLRPGSFAGLASHAGDALFEASYIRDFAVIARALRDKFKGSYEVFFEQFRAAERFDYDLFGTILETYGYAACYTPDETNPGKAVLPFEIDTGRLIDDVWARWLEWDPVRMVPHHTETLAGMKAIYLDAGRSDEYYLDLGAQAVSKELDKAGIEHDLVLFEGTHGGLQYRYPSALRLLATALAP